MDDRFDRRELLLHLGEVLDSMAKLAPMSERGTPVVQLAADEASLSTYPFLGYLAPAMTVSEFFERAAGAYALWPERLLENKLDQFELASCVQRALFEGNSAGWQSYAALMREKVGWFGADIPDIADSIEDSIEGSGNDASQEDDAHEHESSAKAGWPWTPVESQTGSAHPE